MVPHWPTTVSQNSVALYFTLRQRILFELIAMKDVSSMSKFTSCSSVSISLVENHFVPKICFFLLYVNVLSECMCLYYVCTWCSQRSENSIRSLGTGAADCAGNKAWVLCRSSQSSTTEHPSSPEESSHALPLLHCLRFCQTSVNCISVDPLPCS